MPGFSLSPPGLPWTSVSDRLDCRARTCRRVTAPDSPPTRNGRRKRRRSPSSRAAPAGAVKGTNRERKGADALTTHARRDDAIRSGLGRLVDDARVQVPPPVIVLGQKRPIGAFEI